MTKKYYFKYYCVLKAYVLIEMYTAIMFTKNIQLNVCENQSRYII